VRILRMMAENIKKISVVEITPEGSVVEIAGKNGHGKTSVLDTILWGLGGKGGIQWEPVRHGEERGLIEIDLGDDKGLALRVERTFDVDDDSKDGYTTKVKIQRADGLKSGDPQTLLNTLIGGLAFDPLEFQRARPADRLRIIKDMVPDFDFDAMEKRRSELFATRTDEGREAKRLRNVADTVPIQPTTSETLIDTKPLMDRITEAGQKASEIEAERGRRESAAAEARRKHDTASALQEEAKQLRARADQLEQQSRDESTAADDIGARLASLADLPPVPETASVRAEIDKANVHNAQVQKNLERRKYEELAGVQEAKVAELTSQITAIDDAIAKAVEDAELPVRGMTFDGEDVRLHGVPFLQASDAEQLRASVAIAMTANPKLRVIRIRDGSLLDADAMDVLRAVAAQDDYQIWIERVIADSPEAIIMEDGHVKGATTVSVLDQRKKGK
jgi:DNA repair exonuclease SbcCD ATPase subunit